MTSRRRTSFSVLIACVGLGGALAACGPDQSSALDTLPPIQTTTSTTTTTISDEDKTVYYEVQRGDTLGKIARQYAVPRRAVMELNDMNDANLRAGQLLKIPTDVRLDTELPGNDCDCNTTP